ncbi:MAG: sigma-70 family RNA polymerase sigma factor, partial [Haliscomenobacter sp.]
AWLFRILRNTFINQYRQKARQPHKVDYEDFIVHHGDEDSPFRNQTDLSLELFNQMMGDEVTAAVNSLGETYRNVIILADIEEFSYDEIAKILDVPVGTVRSRLHRARKLLKDQLERYAASLGYSENG